MIQKFSIYFRSSLRFGIYTVASFSVLHWIGLAQAQDPRTPVVQSASSNPDVVQDFSASLPPSEPVDRYFVVTTNFETRERANAARIGHDIYFNNMKFVVAHRFYGGTTKAGQKEKRFLQQAIDGFVRECRAKGGYLEARNNSKIYYPTIYRIEKYDRTGYSRFAPRNSPQISTEICMHSATVPLGVLVAVKSKELPADVYDFQKTYSVIVLHPDIVATPERVAAAEEAQQKAVNEKAAVSAREREAAAIVEFEAVIRWRPTIKIGMETGCGPVLSVRGDLIEVVYWQTREPKWFRLSELWPERYDNSGMLTCR